MGLVVGWPRRRMGWGNKWWVRWRGASLSLFGGASSEVRRCGCSVVLCVRLFSRIFFISYKKYLLQKYLLQKYLIIVVTSRTRRGWL